MSDELIYRGVATFAVENNAAGRSSLATPWFTSPDLVKEFARKHFGNLDIVWEMSSHNNTTRELDINHFSVYEPRKTSKEIFILCADGNGFLAVGESRDSLLKIAEERYPNYTKAAVVKFDFSKFEENAELEGFTIDDAVSVEDICPARLVEAKKNAAQLSDADLIKLLTERGFTIS